MAPEEIFRQLVSEWWIFVFSLAPLASNVLYPIFTYVDPIWIRIHNTAVVKEDYWRWAKYGKLKDTWKYD